MDMDVEAWLIVGACVALPLLVGIAVGRLRRCLQQLPEEDLPARNEVERFAATLRARAGTRSRQADPNGQHTCGLCLEDRLTGPVELLPCSHVYCNTCVQALWAHCGRHRRIACPYCRASVEAVFPAYQLRESQAAVGQPVDAAAVQATDRQLHVYNTHPAFAARATVRTRALMLLRGMANVQLLPLVVRFKIGLLILVVFLYVLLPFDLIPDMMGAIGFVDDAALVVLMAVVAAHVMLSVLA